MAGYPQPRKWTPKHPDKYSGDPTQIWARSSWEIKFFNWCDNSPAVISWSSEEIIIPYLCATDNRVHRYFPDALIRVNNSSGVIKTYLVEIKPFSQTQPPTTPKKKTKRYLTEVMTWGKNSSKWKYAKEYCLDRGWEFKIITEHDLGIVQK